MLYRCYWHLNHELVRNLLISALFDRNPSSRSDSTGHGVTSCRKYSLKMARPSGIMQSHGVH